MPLSLPAGSPAEQNALLALRDRQLDVSLRCYWSKTGPASRRESRRACYEGWGLIDKAIASFDPAFSAPPFDGSHFRLGNEMAWIPDPTSAALFERACRALIRRYPIIGCSVYRAAGPTLPPGPIREAWIPENEEASRFWTEAAAERRIDEMVDAFRRHGMTLTMVRFGARRGANLLHKMHNNERYVTCPVPGVAENASYGHRISVMAPDGALQPGRLWWMLDGNASACRALEDPAAEGMPEMLQMLMDVVWTMPSSAGQGASQAALPCPPAGPMELLRNIA